MIKSLIDKTLSTKIWMRYYPRKKSRKDRQIHRKLQQTIEWLLLLLTIRKFKRGKGISNTAKYTNIVGSLSGLNRMGGETQRFDPNHWIKWGNSSSRSWEFNITDNGELNLAQQLSRLGSQKRSNSLYQLCCGLQGHLREKWSCWGKCVHGYIIGTNSGLSGRRGETFNWAGLGVGSNVKEGQALSEDEENKLWKLAF